MAEGVSAPTGMPMPRPTADAATVTTAFRWSSCPSCAATPSMMWAMAASRSGFMNRTMPATSAPASARIGTMDQAPIGPSTGTRTSLTIERTASIARLKSRRRQR